jgi:hypothetical protein
MAIEVVPFREELRDLVLAELIQGSLPEDRLALVEG